MNYQKHTSQSGQILVALLIFMVIAITVTSSTVVIMITNSTAASKVEQSLIAYSIAESGAENAMIRLLRNPNYSGETFTLNGGTAIVTVSSVNGKTIVSEGRYYGFVRKIQVVANYSNNILTVQTWTEIF